eukprot:127961_1
MEPDINSETVVVTGANGYIAGHIIKELLARGYNVRGTVRSLSNTSKYEYLYQFVHPNNDKSQLQFYEAELTSNKNWPNILKGCDYIIHTASPMHTPSNQRTKLSNSYFMEPNLKGMKIILNECAATKTIKRFIYTTGVSTSLVPHKDIMIYDANNWTDLEKPDGYYGELDKYIRSKTVTEKYLWSFIERNENIDLFESVTTISPLLVIGPFLNIREQKPTDLCIKMILNGEYGAYLPQINWSLVDVRDVALAHVNAMTMDKDIVHKQRYILGHQYISCKNIALLLRQEYGNKYNIISRQGSWMYFKILSLFISPLRGVVHGNWNKQHIVCNRPSMKDLNVCYTALNKTIIDSADSLIKFGLVKTKKDDVGKYRSMMHLGVVVVGIASLTFVKWKYF